MTFWLGVLVGFTLMWLLVGFALTAWLIWSLKRIASAAVLSLALSGCAGTSLVVAAAMWLPVCKGNWRFGGMAGAVDGYDPEDRSKREKLATPVLTYERRHWGLDFMPFNGDVMTLLFKLRF